MARGSRSQLTESLEVVEGARGVSREVEHRVLEGAGMPVRQNEPVAVDPAGVGRGVLHDLAPEDVGHRSASHGGSGVARVSRLDHVCGHGADGVDAFFLEIGHGGSGVIAGSEGTVWKNEVVAVVVVVAAIVGIAAVTGG